MKNTLIFFLKKNKNKNKKILIFLIIVIVLTFYLVYRFSMSSETNNLFLIKKVSRGKITKTVSGTGNIASINSFDISSKKGGEIVFLPFAEGDLVKNGTLLMEIDSREIQRQIRDTNLTLINQINNLEKLKLTKINIENNLKKLENEYQSLERADDLRKNYENNLNLLNNFYLEMPSIISKIEDIYFKMEFKNKSVNNNLEYYLNYFDKDYLEKSQRLKKDLDDLKNKFLNISDKFSKLNLKENEIDFNFVRESYDLATKVQSIIKTGLDAIRKIKEDTSFKNAVHIYDDLINNHLNSLNGYYDTLSKYNQSLLDLINKINSLEDNLKQLSIEIENTKFNIKQAEADIKNLEISIEQTKNKLADLQDDLKDYQIYSPINGIISSLKVKKGNNISPGIIMTIVSSDKIAEIKLNEIDVVDIRVGQKVILTFDALPNLEISGRVIQINPIGEISQGVVSYIAKIALETDNPEVKVGMTVNAEIITQVKNNVLIVPASVVKVMNNKKYVEIVDDKDINSSKILINKLMTNKDQLKINLTKSLKLKFVSTGLSDDENIEIIEGLNEGDWVVLKKITPNGETITNDNTEQGLFQRLIPNPRRMIRSPGLK